MKRNRDLTLIALLLCALPLPSPSIRGQSKSTTPSLNDIVKGKGWKLFNREPSTVEDEGRHAIRFDERQGYGAAWVEGSNLDEGTIEVDIKGKNVVQKSFVGIAFRGVDEGALDAIYFRPFNFRSDDPVRHIHAVQYVSYPDFPWERLRRERNGIYEKAVNPAPNPDGWFHARIVIAKRKVSVFVDDAKEPSLVVDELTDRKGSMVGLWIGDGSDGMFANLKITPTK